MNIESLVAAARSAQANAYAPYSGFHVGAALLTLDGQVYAGANVENISFGLTICAERAAFFRAVSDGQRHFSKIVIVADSGFPIYPCGACRQVLAELAPDLEIVAVDRADNMVTLRLSELLPYPKRGILDHS